MQEYLENVDTSLSAGFPTEAKEGDKEIPKFPRLDYPKIFLMKMIETMHTAETSCYITFSLLDLHSTSSDEDLKSIRKQVAEFTRIVQSNRKLCVNWIKLWEEIPTKTFLCQFCDRFKFMQKKVTLLIGYRWEKMKENI